MEFLCPNVEELITCYTCKDQSLPPFRLCCGDSHVTCATCPKYLQSCACGESFAQGPHASFNYLIEAMKFRCKYCVARRREDRDGAAHDDSCGNVWYTIRELGDHYRGQCTANAFVCSLNGCGHRCHVETAVEHYESAHGPFERLEPDNPLRLDTVTFNVPTDVEIFKQIYNGYFLFYVTSPPVRSWRRDVRIEMRNLNPMDRMKYTYNVCSVNSKGETICQVSVTIQELNDD